MTQGIHRYKFSNFLIDCSKVISENLNFWYLTTHRWHCSQLWHGAKINFEGVVAKRQNTVLLKMAATEMGGVLM